MTDSGISDSSSGSSIPDASSDVSVPDASDVSIRDSSSEATQGNELSACDSMTCGDGQYCVHAYPGADGGPVIVGCFDIPAACTEGVPSCSCIAEDFLHKAGPACIMGCEQDDIRHFICYGA